MSKKCLLLLLAATVCVAVAVPLHEPKQSRSSRPKSVESVLKNVESVLRSVKTRGATSAVTSRSFLSKLGGEGKGNRKGKRKGPGRAKRFLNKFISRLNAGFAKMVAKVPGVEVRVSRAWDFMRKREIVSIRVIVQRRSLPGAVSQGQKGSKARIPRLEGQKTLQKRFSRLQRFIQRIQATATRLNLRFKRLGFEVSAAIESLATQYNFPSLVWDFAVGTQEEIKTQRAPMQGGVAADGSFTLGGALIDAAASRPKQGNCNTCGRGDGRLYWLTNSHAFGLGRPPQPVRVPGSGGPKLGQTLATTRREANGGYGLDWGVVEVTTSAVDQQCSIRGIGQVNAVLQIEDIGNLMRAQARVAKSGARTEVTYGFIRNMGHNYLEIHGSGMPTLETTGVDATLQTAAGKTTVRVDKFQGLESLSLEEIVVLIQSRHTEEQSKARKAEMEAQAKREEEERLEYERKVASGEIKQETEEVDEMVDFDSLLDDFLVQDDDDPWDPTKPPPMPEPMPQPKAVVEPEALHCSEAEARRAAEELIAKKKFFVFSLAGDSGAWYVSQQGGKNSVFGLHYAGGITLVEPSMPGYEENVFVTCGYAKLHGIQKYGLGMVMTDVIDDLNDALASDPDLCEPRVQLQVCTQTPEQVALQHKRHQAVAEQLNASPFQPTQSARRDPSGACPPWPQA